MGRIGGGDCQSDERSIISLSGAASLMKMRLRSSLTHCVMEVEPFISVR